MPNGFSGTDGLSRVVHERGPGPSESQLRAAGAAPGPFVRNETAAIMVGDLVYEMASTGLRTPEIEEAREAAWVAISALANALKRRRACWAHHLESSA
jgi:hypothetical protein